MITVRFLRVRVLLIPILLQWFVCMALAAPGAQGHKSAAAAASVLDTIVHHYEYVLTDGRIYIYDIDNSHQLLDSVTVPTTAGTRGVSVSPATGMMYISYGGDGGFRGNGSFLALDLSVDSVRWNKSYSHGIDSHEMSPDGTTIYMPDGELAGNGTWYLVNASTGNETGKTITTSGTGPHNTIVSADGSRVYMGNRDPYNTGNDYLFVADAATDSIVMRVGPFLKGVRPFTVNGTGTIAFVTITNLLGFQVGDISTGRVMDTIDLTTMGFPKSPCITDGFPGNSCQTSHGISLSPDESEVYVIDSPNSIVHVFDVTQIRQNVRPKRIADIHLNHPLLGQATRCAYDCLQIGWLQHSLDGKYVYVGDCGDVIATATHTITAFLPQLRNTRKMIEVDWQNGRVIATSTRQGIGAVTSQSGLSAPVQVYPPNGVVGEPTTVTFQWKPVAGATTYQLQLSEDSLFSSVAAEDSGIGTTWLQIPGLHDSTRYYWRVRAGASGAWSGNWWFQTMTNGSFSYGLLTGWNMVSVPLSSARLSVLTLLPGLQTQAFAYNGAYVPIDTLTAGIGYWLRVPLPVTVVYNGSLSLAETLNVSAGWNLIGSIGVSVPVQMVASQPPGLVASRFFAFNGSSYTVEDTLKAGLAYWASFSGAGKLILSSTGGAALEDRIVISPSDEIPPLPPIGLSGSQAPTSWSVMPNYPNPFNPSTQLSYQLPVRSSVMIAVYNLLGEQVALLRNGVDDAGYKTVVWTADKALPSGIYLYRFEAVSVADPSVSYSHSGKMILLK